MKQLWHTTMSQNLSRYTQMLAKLELVCYSKETNSICIKILKGSKKRYANKELLPAVFGKILPIRIRQIYTGIFRPQAFNPAIALNPIHAYPARCKRLLLRLQKYDYKFSCKPGKEHIIPDTLSRATKCVAMEIVLQWR